MKLRSEDQERAVVLLEGAANVFRGVALDPRVPPDTRAALRSQASEIDAFTERVCEEDLAEGGGAP